MQADINNAFARINKLAHRSIIPEQNRLTQKYLTKSEEGRLHAFAHRREAIRFWHRFLL
jgi:hypothetical protein